MKRFLKRLRCLAIGHQWEPLWSNLSSKGGAQCGIICHRCGVSVDLLAKPRP